MFPELTLDKLFPSDSETNNLSRGHGDKKKDKKERKRTNILVFIKLIFNKLFASKNIQSNIH